MEYPNDHQYPEEKIGAAVTFKRRIPISERRLKAACSRSAFPTMTGHGIGSDHIRLSTVAL